MTTDINIPWHKYALIADLAKRMEEYPHQFGKTALQKLIFLLQELYEVKCGYEFRLYNYGPFSSQLLQDLDLVDVIEGVNVHSVSWGMGGYMITKGSKNDAVISMASDFIEANKDRIKTLTENFGNFTAKELELRSTIVYTSRYYSKLENELDKSELIEMVNSIKPNFSEDVVRSAVIELESNGYI